jgi:hypothetical protein
LRARLMPHGEVNLAREDPPAAAGEVDHPRRR